MQTASAVGIPSKISWSTTAIRRIVDGEVYLAVGISGSEEAPHSGRAFVRAVELLSLDSAGNLYQGILGQLQKIPPELAISLSLLYRQESKITVFTFGFALVGLLRKGQSRWLIDGSQERQVLEGVIQPEDQILLGTAPVRELSASFDEWAEWAPDEIGAELVGKFQKVDNSGELSALILKEPRFEASSPISSKEDVGGEERIEVADDAALFPPTPLSADLPVSVSSLPQFDSSKHLIPPEKLHAGILATQEDQTTRWKQAWSADRLAQGVQALRQLSWLKIALSVGVIVTLIGGLFAWRAWGIQQEYRSTIVPLEELVQQAESYPDDQRLQQRDTVRSLLERLEATRVSNRSNRTELQVLIDKMRGLYSSISGEREVVNLPVFYDFRLVAADFLATRADRFEDQAVFFDTNGEKIISLNLRSKSNQTVSNEALAQASDLVAANGESYVLTPDSIRRVPLSGSSISELAPISVPDPVSMDRFAENLYVFSKGNQQLWRFPIAGEQDASPSAWVRSAPGIDFSTVTSLSIDGSVWMGTSDGSVYKLTRGERESFKIEGMLEPFTNSLLLSAIETGNRLAVVEPSSNRLVILDKSGVYQQQVRSEQIGGVTDVFWDEEEKAVFLIAGSVVYRVEL